MLALKIKNLEGWGIIPQQGGDKFRYPITASVTDFNGNPVKSGTAVDFSVDFGTISGSAVTDEEGLATVVLRPDGSTPTIANGARSLGITVVTGKTVDQNNDDLIAEIEMLFTTRRAVPTVTPTTINIDNGGSQTFDLTVVDGNGFPMAAGTTIEVELSGGLESANTAIDIPDSFIGGAGITEFSFGISDYDPDDATTVDAQISFVITTPSCEQTILQISGSKSKPRIIYPSDLK